MKISLIIIIERVYEIKHLVDCINSLKQQTIGFENLEVIVIDRIEENVEEGKEALEPVLNEQNIHYYKNEKINLDVLKGKYICFYDLNYKIPNNSFYTLYRISEKYNLDFISANETNNDLFSKEEVINYGYTALVSLKLIKKEILKTNEFKFIHNINRKKIRLVSFLLYASNYKFVFSKETKYNVINDSEQGIYREIDDVSFVADYLLSRKEIEYKFAILLIKQCLKIIDSRIFLEEADYGNQLLLLKSLNAILQQENNDLILQEKSINRYKAFLNFINKELYYEGIQYMKLLRSKRYWYHQYQDLKAYTNKYPYNLEDSLSWKLTKPLRSLVRSFNKLKENVYKFSLVIASHLLNLIYLYKPIWLIAERADQAEDNGYFFFKYCREHYPKEKVFYIIKENSPHFQKVNQLGNVLRHSSLKHKLYLLAANVYISAWTFNEGAFPENPRNFQRLFSKKISKKMNICLQHGVIIQNISPYLHKERYKQNLIIASSELEKDIIMNTLEYENNEIAVTGLARFDNLHDLNPKNQILIMPTWRRHLSNISVNEFLESDYYNKLNDLIRNKNFLELVEKNDIIVKFYVHNQMQKFIKAFSFSHPNIQFLDKSNSVVSELLKESSLLITDYSSVSMDFLFMKKAVLFYQFDLHNNHHTPVDQIQYHDIGKISNSLEELLLNIEEVVRNNFKPDEKYIINSKKIYKYTDNKNCERIYRAIKEKTQKGESLVTYS
jgi:CDP-glycerol glycerophosphotransferase (TagB/SpsB family)